jgi:hypothetical protein
MQTDYAVNVTSVRSGGERPLRQHQHVDAPTAPTGGASKQGTSLSYPLPSLARAVIQSATQALFARALAGDARFLLDEPLQVSIPRQRAAIKRLLKRLMSAASRS